MSNIGDQVWLMTSRQTEPELNVLVLRIVKDIRNDSHLVNVWVKYSIHEAYARTLVWILIWQLHMDLPNAAFEWCYKKNDEPMLWWPSFHDVLSSGPLNRT